MPPPSPRRFDSLFVRLLLSQLALVLTLGLVFGGLFYVERNTSVAVLYADLWGPELASAAGLRAGAPGAAPLRILQRDGAPEGTYRPSRYAPRFVALRHALAAQGVEVDEVRLSLRTAEPMVWLQVRRAGQPALWLGVAGQLLVPEWPRRTLLAMALLTAVLVLASWALARWLTRPLEQLRLRIQNQQPGEAGLPALATGPAAGSPEIAAIHTAYSDLLARLAQHERERAVLLAGVSHDLRSPLGRIRMAAELLPDAEGTRTRQEAIVRNVGVADRLIESFLDYVRSGTLALDATVDLAAVARAAAARFEPPAGALQVELPASLPWPQANELLVDRLITNLLDNAFKHGCAPVVLRVAATAQGACMEVQDAGPGLPPGSAAQMQEAFTRGNGSRGIPGTGLGLAIVRQIAARLGGEVSMASAPGRHLVRVLLQRRPGP
ncbi:MAG: sensor histidine kinase [Ramlibacter sp.]